MAVNALLPNDRGTNYPVKLATTDKKNSNCIVDAKFREF